MIPRRFGVHGFTRHRYQQPALPVSRLQAAGRPVVEQRLREYLEVGRFAKV